MTRPADTAYPIVANAAIVNESHAQDFMSMLFSRVLWKRNHFVNLRGVGEKGTPREGAFHADEFIQPGLEEFPDEHVVEVTIRHIKRWSQYHIAAFVVPAVLKAAQGRSENVDLQVAVVVDLDTGDTRAKAAWIDEHIGTPTMVVLSGGTTDAGTPKMHLYWVLDDPEENVAAVVEARHLLAEKIGGDLQFGRGTPDNPLGRAHQPIRIAGSVHAKHGREGPVQLVWSSGPTPEFGWLLWKIRNAPRSPWFVEARVAPASTGFDFGPTKNHHIGMDDVIDSEVCEGGEGANTRYAAIGKVIGGMIGMARDGRFTLEQAQERAYAWMQTQMRPPLPDAAFNNHWYRLLNRDVAAKGALPAAQAVPAAAKPMVTDENLGIRQWATHRWSQGTPGPRQFLVEGLVLSGKAHMLAAEGGAGKTFSMLDLALKVATLEEGDDCRWWGSRVLKGGTAVILTTEDDQSELHIRLHELDPEGRRFVAGERLIVVPLINAGGAFPFVQRDKAGNPTFTAKWLETLDHLRGLKDLQMVVVDVLSTTLHGDENASQVVNEYIKALEPVCGELGATLMVTHHIRKQDSRFPIKTAEDMAGAVRGSTGLIGGFRAVLGIWHCHDYTKRMQAMGLEPERKQLWRMGVLKANNPEMMRGIKFLLRKPCGVLEDATDQASKALSGVHVQREAWLYAAVDAAARAGAPYSGGKKSAEPGLYERRAELHACLREDGFGKTELPKLVEKMISRKQLVVVQCQWVTAGKTQRRLMKPTLDVPGGTYTQDNPEPIDPTQWSYRVPDWERTHRFDEVEGMVVPMDAPRLIFPSADAPERTQ